MHTTVGMSQDYMHTPSGVINVRKPHKDEICIEDVARGLSSQYRFCGFLRANYSSLEHSLDGAITLLRESYGVRDSLRFLLHDSAEAYTSDVPSPIKRLIGDSLWWELVECRFYEAIMEALMPNVTRRDMICPGEIVWMHDFDGYIASEEYTKFGNQPPTWYTGDLSINHDVYPQITREISESLFIGMYHGLVDLIATQAGPVEQERFLSEVLSWRVRQ